MSRTAKGARSAATPPMSKPLSFVLTASLGLWSTAVPAATCEEALEELADAYGLSIAVPQHQVPGGDTNASPAVPDAAGTGPSLSERLAETGGVLQPPPTGDPAVIEPPPVASDMPTAPKIEPDEPETSEEPLALAPAGPELDAATRTQVESLLYAGMAAAAEGREEQCLERLQEAQSILEPGRTPAIPQRN